MMTCTRRRFLQTAALLSTSMMSNVLTAFPHNDQKKNLLFIITDQQRYDALGVAGNTVLQTPNLDRLAQEGAFFKKAYTPCAVCGPARSSILTGCTVEHTQVRTNNHTFDYHEEGLMTMPTFDELLTDHGYHCEYYGKWHSPSNHAKIYKNPVQKANDGRWIFAAGGQSHIYLDYLNQHENNRLLRENEFYDLMTHRPYRTDPLDKYYGMTAAEMQKQNLKHIQPDQHGKLLINKNNTLTAFQAKQTLEAIERLQNKTFSITCSFHFPHSPILPAEPYYSMYLARDMLPPSSIADKMTFSPYQNANGRKNNTEYADPDKIKYMISNYYGLVREIDDWVGHILDKLDELDLTQKTMVVFTSDHGEMLGAHGMREKNVFYEESARIPLLIRLPNDIPAGTTVEGYTSTIDLFPTILDYLNIDEYPSDGKSLRGMVEGTDNEHGRYVVTEWDWRGDSEPNYMIVKDGWKLMIPYTRSSSVISALYDLNSDPFEMNNLLSTKQTRTEHSEKLIELQSALLEWLQKNNSKHYEDVDELLGKLTSVEADVEIPTEYDLGQNFPNPFNPTTTIPFQIPADGHVKLNIYDALGRNVKTLVDEYRAAGDYAIEYDASNLASGVYFYRIQSNDFKCTKKFILQK